MFRVFDRHVAGSVDVIVRDVRALVARWRGGGGARLQQPDAGVGRLAAADGDTHLVSRRALREVDGADVRASFSERR